MKPVLCLLALIACEMTIFGAVVGVFYLIRDGYLSGWGASIGFAAAIIGGGAAAFWSAHKIVEAFDRR